MFLAPSGANPPRAAFTLLELLVVLGIVLVLAGTIVAAASHASASGKAARTRVELAVLAGALEDYRRTYGDYPRTEDAALLLQSLLGRRDPGGAVVTGRALVDLTRFTVGGARDPSTDPSAQLVDAWAQPYRYAYKVQVPWVNSRFVLYSIGPDGCDSPALLTGGFADAGSPLNADNLYAGP